MDNETTFSTWDVLKSFGFQPDFYVFSDIMPGLKFDFGNLTLSAICCMNMQLVEIVSLDGILRTKDTIAEVYIQLPRQIESSEQCAAWIVWHLDNVAKGRVFCPIYEPVWLSEGRNHKYLLPWIRQQEEYRVRPHCTVEREWLKLVLKSLSKHLEPVADTETVEIGFDGKVLSFRLSEKIVVSVAEGSAWLSTFTIPAWKLRKLPKRLMNNKVDVSIWESRLQIGQYRYGGIIEAVLNSTVEKNL